MQALLLESDQLIKPKNCASILISVHTVAEINPYLF